MDSLKWSQQGKVIILGDFNVRVGELSNHIYELDDEVVEPIIIQRKSVDKKVDALGKKVLAYLNAAGLVLLNGTDEEARWTSFQFLANSVVDLVWISLSGFSGVNNFKVWNEDFLQLGDHALVSFELTLEHQGAPVAVLNKVKGVGVSSGPSEVKRWNVAVESTNPGFWCKLQQAGHELLGDGRPTRLTTSQTMFLRELN